MSDGSYYTGITNNLSKRIHNHSIGQGSKYVKSRLPIIKIKYIEINSDRTSSSKREIEIKRLSKKDKVKLVTGLMVSNIKKVFCPLCEILISISQDVCGDNEFNVECHQCNKIIKEKNNGF